MSFSASLERHRRSLLTIAFALGLAGIFAAISLPVGLFPVTSFPRIRIEVDAGSMPARQTLVEVTQPLEQVARAVPGAQEVTSTTSRGVGGDLRQFPLGLDMNQALLRVGRGVRADAARSASGTSYDAIQMSPNVLMPFVSYALISETVSPSDAAPAGAVPDRPAAHGHPGYPTRRRARRSDARRSQVSVDSAIGCAPMA